MAQWTDGRSSDCFSAPFQNYVPMPRLLKALKAASLRLLPCSGLRREYSLSMRESF